jgi:glycosyltransferase involved in cell wall biosynthesis
VHVSVAMITMNEEGAVAGVVGDIKRVVPEAEIVLVDSSKDRTAEIAESMGCRVIKQFPPRGYGPAMDRVLRECRGDVVVTLDCDNTYPVEAIPGLVAEIDAGWDLVNATRLAVRPKTMPFENYLANRLFAVTTRVVHGLKTTDVHSGMRAYRRTMLEKLAWTSEGAALPVELLILPHRLGYKVKDVPIEYRERIGVSTLNRLSSTVWTFRRIFRLAAVSRAR